MGMALCHLLEMPAKIAYDGALWLTLLQTLYRTFGTIGAFIEVGAVVTAVVLVFLVRRRWPAFGSTLGGARGLSRLTVLQPIQCTRTPAHLALMASARRAWRC